MGGAPVGRTARHRVAHPGAFLLAFGVLLLLPTAALAEGAAVPVAPWTAGPASATGPGGGAVHATASAGARNAAVATGRLDGAPVALSPPSRQLIVAGTSEYARAPGTGTLPTGQGTSLAYDPVLGTFVAYGGSTREGRSVTYSNATWLYDDGAWEQICPSADDAYSCTTMPPAAAGALLIWDASDNELLMTGGVGPNASNATPGDTAFLTDLWGFSQGHWTNLSAGVPPGLANAQIAYDSEDGYVLAFSAAGTTYSYAHGGWTAIADAVAKRTPPARTHAALFDDPAIGGVVLYGGVGTKNQSLNDTWVYSAGSWRKLSDAGAPTIGGRGTGAVLPIPLASAYDSNRGVGVLFDPPGTGTGETWWLQNGTWVNETTFLAGPLWGTHGASLAWDPIDGYGLLLQFPTAAGSERAFSLSDPLQIAVGATRAVMDAGQEHVFAPAISQGLDPYTTSLVGPVTGCALTGNTTAAPEVTCRESAAATDDVTLHFSDSIGRAANATYRLVVHADPTIEVSSVSPDPTSVGIPVSFQATPSLGTLPYATLSWRFDSGAFVSEDEPSETFNATGPVDYSVTLVDATGYAVEAHGSLEVNADPAAVLASNRTGTDAGLPLAFTANVSGGTGTVSCAWDFGAGATSTACDPDHAFGGFGLRTVRFWANDSVGAVGEQNLTVSIAPPVEAELGSPSASAVPGVSVPFTVAGLDGTPPYSEAWSFGDGGSAVGANVTHAFGLAGTYTVSVTITDSVGGTVTATESVSVGLPATGTAPPGTTAPPSGTPGSMVVPGPGATAPPPSSFPFAIVELAVAVALAAGWMTVERHRRARGGPTDGWVRRIFASGRAPAAEATRRAGGRRRARPEP